MTRWANFAVWWNGPDGFDERGVTELPTLGPHGSVDMDPGNIMNRGARGALCFDLPSQNRFKLNVRLRQNRRGQNAKVEPPAGTDRHLATPSIGNFPALRC